MLKLLLSAALLLSTAPALAQSEAAPAAEAATATAPVIKRGAKIVSSDGKLVGRIDSVNNVNGTPVAAKVIYRSRFVSIPVSTLSTSGDRLVSSLSIEAIKGL